MLKKLLCILWGCRMSQRAPTGHTYVAKVSSVDGREATKEERQVFQPELLSFCPRCGKPNGYHPANTEVPYTAMGVPGEPETVCLPTA